MMHLPRGLETCHPGRPGDRAALPANDELPDSVPPVSSVSRVSIKRPSVMMVRIEPGEEQDGLDLESLAIRVFRVRHPLQACVRMHVLEPEVILIGESVKPWDLARVLYDAHAIMAASMPRSQMIAGERLREWTLYAIDLVRQRREEVSRARAVAAE